MQTEGLCVFMPNHAAHYAVLPSQRDFTGELYSFFRVIGVTFEVYPRDEDFILSQVYDGQFLVEFIDEPFTVLSPVVSFSEKTIDHLLTVV